MASQGATTSSPAERAEQDRHMATLLQRDPAGVVDYVNRHDELQGDRALDHIFGHHCQGGRSVWSEWSRLIYPLAVAPVGLAGGVLGVLGAARLRR